MVRSKQCHQVQINCNSATHTRQEDSPHMDLATGSQSATTGSRILCEILVIASTRARTWRRHHIRGHTTMVKTHPTAILVKIRDPTLT
jgi:hypothetical protein